MGPHLKISIITATRNSAATILDCLHSVAAQDYDNVEHIVIDGASNDGITLDILNANIDNFTTLISEPDAGIYCALNKGLNLATGDIIGFLHSDDFFSSNYVLSKIATAFNDPSVCAVYGDLIYVSRDNTSNIIRRWRSKSFNSSDILKGWMPPHPTLYVRREWYKNIGGFNEQYKISADYLSILKLFSHPTFKAVYIPSLLVTMRVGGVSNKSFKFIITKSLEDWSAIRSCDHGIFVAFWIILMKNIRKIAQFF